MTGSSRCRLAVLLSVALCGCAAKGPARIGTDARPLFTATEVVVHVPQADLEVDWAGNTIGTMQTLIASAFDSDREMSKDPTQAVASMRAALAGFNFDQQWTGALDEAARGTDWLNARPAVLVKEKQFGNALAKQKAATPGTLFISTRYSLSPDLSTLRIVTFACAFVQKRPAVRDCAAAKYRNLLSYSVKRARLKAMDQNLAAWLADDSLRNALHGGVKVLANMVVSDIANPSPPPQGAVRSVMVQGQGVQALSSEESSDGVTVRYADGSIGFFATPLKP